MAKKQVKRKKVRPTKKIVLAEAIPNNDQDKLTFYSFHLITRLQQAQKGLVDAREIVHHLEQTARAIKFYCFDRAKSKTKKGGK